MFLLKEGSSVFFIPAHPYTDLHVHACTHACEAIADLQTYQVKVFQEGTCPAHLPHLRQQVGRVSDLCSRGLQLPSAKGGKGLQFLLIVGQVKIQAV